jgi:hypothetical protein
MHELAAIVRRLELLSAKALAGPVDEALLDDIEHALNEGYVCALRADARSRRLRERIDDLLDDVHDRRPAEAARRLAAQERRIDEAARGLRARLTVLRALAAPAAGARGASA